MSIELALTAEEWAGHLCPAGFVDPHDAHFVLRGGFVAWFDAAHGAAPAVGPHALAALALHGQAFGFTREDVEALRDCVSDAAGTTLSYDDETQARIRRAYNACDRIAALLPPTP